MLKVFDFKEIFSAQIYILEKLELNSITYQTLSLTVME